MYSPEPKDYVVVTPYGYEEELTASDLWSWYLYNQPDSYSWFELLDKLKDEGEARFSNNAIVRYKLHRTNAKKENSTGCSHKEKYKNHAGGIYFWYCPSCKADLGNA
jgi:hypothetical protein